MSEIIINNCNNTDKSDSVCVCVMGGGWRGTVGGAVGRRPSAVRRSLLIGRRSFGAITSSVVEGCEPVSRLMSYS